jgi:hypothetical protein
LYSGPCFKIVSITKELFFVPALCAFCPFDKVDSAIKKKQVTIILFRFMMKIFKAVLLFNSRLHVYLMPKEKLYRRGIKRHFC